VTSKRIFIGSFIRSTELYDLFNEVKNEMKFAGNIKWTASENNLHFTCIFLGETDLNKTEKIRRLLTPLINKDYNIPLKISGLKYFTHKGKPSVLYAQIKDTQGKLNELQKQIKTILTENALIRNDKPKKFIPHITFARIKNINKSFYEIIEEYKDLEITYKYPVRINIIESILKPSGAIYKTLQ